MTKYLTIDFRMRDIEKEYLKNLGYVLIENQYNLDLYDEIASHVDISYVKIQDDIIVSPDKYVDFSKILKCNVGKTELGRNYPLDIPYNVCIMGKKAIHNFIYTDSVVKEKLEEKGFECINVNQGYANCAIAVIDEKSCITSDIGIAKTLVDNGIDVLFVKEPDIKLLKRIDSEETYMQRMSFEYSNMKGFIGGAMACLKNEVIIFGDVNKLLNRDKIIKFIESKGKKVKSFEGLDVIDYGSVLEI